MREFPNNNIGGRKLMGKTFKKFGEGVREFQKKD